MITSFVQERMRIGGFEIDAGEYCFLVCKWIRVCKKKNGGVKKVYSLFIKEMFDLNRGMMFVQGGDESEKGALPVLPSSDDVIQISVIEGRFELAFVERFSLPLPLIYRLA